MKEIEYNYKFNLPVWEGVDSEYSESTEKLIGSEIEPIKLYEIDETTQYSKNGLDVYIETGWLVKQQGKFFVVETRESGYDHEQAGREISHSWEAYFMEKTIQIDRVKAK